MRIFLDANILFSAAKSDGAIRELLRRLLDAGHECWIDDFVVAEARRNLVAKGPGAIGNLDALIGRLNTGTVREPPRPTADVDWLPVKDRPVLDAAIRLGCDALVTGDRTHFGPGFGRSYSGVTIHAPASEAGNASRRVPRVFAPATTRTRAALERARRHIDFGRGVPNGAMRRRDRPGRDAASVRGPHLKGDIQIAMSANVTLLHTKRSRRLASH